MACIIRSALFSCIASACLLGAASAALMAAPLQPISTHHEVQTEPGRGGVPIVEVTINGKGPYKFVVDTGAPGPLRIDTTVADALGLTPIRYEDEGDGSEENNFRVPVVAIAAIGIGDFSKTGLEANVMDLKGRGFAFDGVFGMAAFADHILTIDYARGALAIDEGALPEPNGADVFSYDLTEEGFIRLQVAIGSDTLPAILDTGQTMSGIIVPEAFGKKVAAGLPVEVGKARTVSNAYPMYEVEVTAPILAQGVRLPIEKIRYPSIAPEANIGSLAFKGGVLRIDQRNRRLQLDFRGREGRR